MVSDINKLLAGMEPGLNPGTYAFVLAPATVEVPSDRILASIREPEGLSLVIPESVAHGLNLPVVYSAAWITLKVHSDLAAVGLTAAFSAALAKEGISCNVIAGVHHDHLFVPAALAQQAMDVLLQLQASAACGSGGRSTDAQDPLPGQAGGRTGQGQGQDDDSA